MSGPMERSEHLAWCKRRALQYVEAGDLKQAVASMASDLGKHDDFRAIASSPLMLAGLGEAIRGDAGGVRRWVEGFN